MTQRTARCIAARALAGGLTFSGLIVAVTSLTLRWLKISLHTAFATFSACLLWPCMPAVLGLLVAGVGVAWSRLALKRHRALEVALGALLGLAAGSLLMTLASTASPSPP